MDSDNEGAGFQGEPGEPGEPGEWVEQLMYQAGRLLLIAFWLGGGFLAAPGAYGDSDDIPSSDQKTDYRQSIVWTDSDCRSCHEIDQPLFSHPVDVRPSIAVPEQFPLEYDRLACTSCHINDVNTHARSRQQHDGMLRDGGVPGTAFCVKCHGTNNNASRPSHALATGKAHLYWQDRRTGAADSTNSMFKPLGLRRQLTAQSAECLSCHDGGSAPAVGNSHSVGVAYRMDHKRRTRPMKLVPLSQLDSRIRLFNNKVECGSCHSPFSKHEKQLVMANPNSELCIACHKQR